MTQIDMKYLRAIAVTLGILCAAPNIYSSEGAQQEYEEALDLIHAFSGSGGQLQQAARLSDKLAASNPQSGYAQTLQAESLSTWELDQDGQPEPLRSQIIQLANEAIRLNPRLAQAYVAKARVLVRASMYIEADDTIDAALKIEPTLSGAIFLRAEVFRRTYQYSMADAAYRQFIQSTESRTRKSNGYAWLGRMYEAAARNDPAERAAFTAKAREAYEQMLELDPSGAWKNVNFAIFLNGYAADFNGAERYAQRALNLMDFRMARYHLAAARYQRLWQRSLQMNRDFLGQSVEGIAISTKIPLRDAIAFDGFSSVVRGRLVELQSRVPG